MNPIDNGSSVCACLLMALVRAMPRKTTASNNGWFADVSFSGKVFDVANTHYGVATISRMLKNIGLF